MPELYDASVLTSRYSVGPHDALMRTRQLLHEEGSSRAFRPARSCMRRWAWPTGRSVPGVRGYLLHRVRRGWKYLSTGAYEGTIEDAEQAISGQLWA